MKNLRLLSILMITLLISSCSDSDDSNDSNDDDGNNPSGEPGISATINGGTFDDYTFTASVTNLTFDDDNTTLNIDAGDTNGEQITVFMNSTNGFNANATKEIANVDSNNFRTFVLIRQQSPQLSYNSTSGSVTITENVVNPADSNQRLISGRFNNIAASTSANNNTVMTGTFTELAYDVN